MTVRTTLSYPVQSEYDATKNSIVYLLYFSNRAQSMRAKYNHVQLHDI